MTTTNARSTASRPTWKDVYELIESHRLESREDHRRIEDRLTALELRDSQVVGRAQGERRILGLAKSTVAVLLAGASFVVSAIGQLHLIGGR